MQLLSLLALHAQACDPGSFGASAADCQACAPGTYQPTPYSISCLEAPAGTFSKSGAAEPELCAPGSSSGAGAAECAECAADTYADLAGSTGCAPCPEGTSAEAGAFTCVLAGVTDDSAACGGPLTTMVELSNDAASVVLDLGESAFNANFCKCGIVRYFRNGVTHSVYHRLTEAPEGFNAYKVFTDTWSGSGNVMGTDFKLYDSCTDLESGEGAWSYCNYDDADVGYPRDCGKTGGVGNAWFSMPGDRFNARGINGPTGFEVETECEAGPGCAGVTTTSSTSMFSSTTTSSTTTTTSTLAMATEALNAADASGVVSDATATAKAAGDRLGWHMTWNPEKDAEAEKFVAKVCSGASSICRRYVYVMHECYPECKDKMSAAGELRGPDPDYQEVGLAGVDAHKANAKQTQEDWEVCLTDCAVRPSCPKMCGTDTEGCLPKCYENYKPMVASMEKIYARVYAEN